MTTFREERTCSFLSWLAAAALAVLSTALMGCAEEGHAAPPRSEAAPAQKTMRLTPPNPNSLEGQHGGFFSVGLPARAEYAGAEALAASHPLHAQFQAEVKAAEARLTWQGKPLRDLLKVDATAARLWTEAVSAPVVGDSRRDAQGAWLVVVRADVLPLTRYLRTGE